MALMDLINGFRGVTTTTPAQTTVGDNKTIPNPSNNPDKSTVGAIPDPATGDKSPLENYKDLWQLDTKAAATVALTPDIEIDNNKIMTLARTVDFTKAMDPVLLDKAGKGDSAALGSIINTAAQNGYAQAAAMTLNIVKAALTKQEENFTTKVMPDILRKHSISTMMADGNDLARDPAVAPLLSVIERQMSAKYTTASAAEIKQHSENYLLGLAEGIIKAGGGTVTKTSDTNPNNRNTMTRSDEPDWESLLLQGSTQS